MYPIMILTDETHPQDEIHFGLPVDSNGGFMMPRKDEVIVLESGAFVVVQVVWDYPNDRCLVFVKRRP